MAHNTTQIVHDVVQVEHINEFAHADGSGKKLGEPYWVLFKDDTWSFDFIRANTDSELLKHNIAAGAVYRLVRVHE